MEAKRGTAYASRFLSPGAVQEQQRPLASRVTSGRDRRSMTHRGAEITRNPGQLGEMTQKD